MRPDAPDLERYCGYLRLLAQARLGPLLRGKLEASDLVQQSLLEAYQGLAAFRGGTEAELLAWLRRILARNVANVWRDYQRDRRDVGREQGLGGVVEAWLAAEESSPSERASRQEEAVRLAAALEGLGEAQRQVVELRHLHGWALADIARHIGRSAAAVAGLLHRGLAELRERLRE